MHCYKNIRAPIKFFSKSEGLKEITELTDEQASAFRDIFDPFKLIPVL